MKKAFLFGLAGIFFVQMAIAGKPAQVSLDTTVRIDDKVVVINETEDDIDITLYRYNADGTRGRSEQVFKGVYLKGRSIEQRFRNTIFDVPLNLTRSSKCTGDKRIRSIGLGSFKLGFVNLTCSAGEHINASSSLRYTLGLMSVSYRLNDWLVIAPNLDIEFNSIHLKNNHSFSGCRGAYPSAPGCRRNHLRQQPTAHYLYERRRTVYDEEVPQLLFSLCRSGAEVQDGFQL